MYEQPSCMQLLLLWFSFFRAGSTNVYPLTSPRQRGHASSIASGSLELSFLHDSTSWSRQFESSKLEAQTYGRQPLSWDEQSRRTALCGNSMHTGQVASAHAHFSVVVNVRSWLATLLKMQWLLGFWLCDDLSWRDELLLFLMYLVILKTVRCHEAYRKKIHIVYTTTKNRMNLADSMIVRTWSQGHFFLNCSDLFINGLETYPLVDNREALLIINQTETFHI